jgi:hypothetical protein
MADDIVITEFGADLTAFNTEVDKAAKSIDNLDKEMQGASNTGKQLSGNMGDASKKVAVLGATSKKTAKDIDQVGESAANIGDKVSKGSGGVLGFLDKIKSAFVEFGKGAKEGINDAFNELPKASDKATKKAKKDVDGFGSTLKDGLKDSIEDAGSQFGVLGKAVASLGPIGLAVLGVLGGLVSIFANTDAGATYFDGLKRAGGIAFDKITGAVTGFFDALTDGQSTIGKVFGFLGDAIDTVTAPLQFLVSGIGDLTGITQFFKDANKEGQELANAYDAIDQAQYENIKRNAELEKQVSSLNIRLRDRTLSQEDALKIADELAAKEKERAANELAILKMTTAAKQKEADNELKNKREVSDETARALAEAQAAEIKAAQQSENLQEQASVRVNLINEKAANQQAAIAAKQRAEAEKAAAQRKAAAEKAAAEAVKLAEQVAAATAKANDIKAAPKEEARRAKLTPDEIKVDDLSKQYQKQLDDAKAAFEQLRKLKEGDAEAIAQIDKEMADNALAIEANKNAALTKLSDEQLAKVKEENDAKLKLIHEATTDEETLQTEAINKKFEDLESAAKDVITNEEDLTAALVELEMQRQEQLAQISADAAQKRTDAQIQNAQDVLDAASNLGSGLVAIDKANTDNKIASLDAQIEAQKKYGQDTTALEAKREEEQKKAARRAYAIQKAFALAQLAMDTAKAISSLTAAAAANPTNAVTFGAAGVAQFAAGMIQILANIAQATALLTSKAPGLYKGDPYVSGKADRPGRDGHLRWLDEGERVVTAKSNAKHWDLYEAIRLDKLDQWKAANMNPIALNFERIAKVPDTTGLMAYNFAPLVNNYVDGNYSAVTLTIPKGHDKGMIKATRESTREQRRTNDILEAMSTRKTSTPSKRLW